MQKILFFIFLLQILAFPKAILTQKNDDQFIVLDIHVKVSLLVETEAIQLNSNITHYDPNNDIDLKNVALPHCTLYLTSFYVNDLDNIKQGVSEAIKAIKPCLDLRMGKVSATGTYGMWEMEKPDCLQQMSDLIVTNTKQFIQPNQPIPAWVKNLPEPIRDLKIKMIQEYGSPNVFSQFAPHVTIGYDNSTTTNFDKIVNSLRPKPISYETKEIGIGISSKHGTVLRGKDLADYFIQPPQ
ncbi:hypothetical protein M0812_08504 [Anaeramoeba flamelloides]|uniref:2'-5' RNA ligase family protein n=1 Tax=Anaeramoeba flamelloides TaxID=1746091 RepID=A0AAV7ZXQ6_9EUKA|nr:hypothetical protein M0812_08504 [Anaeramoeba flamelloides]